MMCRALTAPKINAPLDPIAACRPQLTERATRGDPVSQTPPRELGRDCSPGFDLLCNRVVRLMWKQKP